MSNIILDISGIDGECTLNGFVGKIVCNSMSVSFAQELDKSKNQTRTVNTVTVEDISIERPFDKSSAKIMKKICTGKSCGEVKIHLLKAAADDALGQVEYMTFTLTDTLIATHEVSFGETDATETITLSFTKIEFEYKEQKVDGSLGGSVVGNFNVALGKAEK